MSVAGNNRRFAHTHTRVSQLTTSVDHTPYHGDSRFEDFPSPPGESPYHLALGEILHQSEIDQIVQNKKLVFHTTGDTGNFKNDLQLDVADLLRSDAEPSGAKFLYHLDTSRQRRKSCHLSWRVVIYRRPDSEVGTGFEPVKRQIEQLVH